MYCILKKLIKKKLAKKKNAKKKKVRAQTTYLQIGRKAGFQV